jgi:uncharacterized protein (TIGR00661 family)
MNILYGVSGEGMGHASHALAIASYLEKKGHNVLIITYGQASEILKTKFKVFEVNGFHLVYDSGKMNYAKTIAFNAQNFCKNIFYQGKLKKILNEFKPDICITDMEPIVALVSYSFSLPLISISNQNRFVNYDNDYPMKFVKDYILAKAAIKMIVPYADYYITLAFSNPGKPSKKNSYHVPPIIRNEVRELRVKEKNKIVVYLTRDNKNILNLLKKIKENFVIFGYNANKCSKNLTFKKREDFLSELKDSKGLISNSGFTSIGESIYLKKPYLAVPLKGQFEQVFNALYVEKQGFGKFVETLTTEDIIDFISNLDFYNRNLAKEKPFDTNKLYKILDNILEKLERKVVKEKLQRKSKKFKYF